MINTLLLKFRSGLLLLAFSLALSFNAAAQTCGTPPTCESLGYIFTELKCASIASLKCPFDKTKVYCAAPVMVGDILYSDKYFSSNLVPSKTPIGVVFDIDKRLAVALDYESKNSVESEHDMPQDVEGLKDDNGKLNTNLILAFMKKSNAEQPYEIHYPAVEYAANYSTSGTKKGDWYLASAEEGGKLAENNSIVMQTFRTIKNDTSTALQAALVYGPTSSIEGEESVKTIGGSRIKLPKGAPAIPVINF